MINNAHINGYTGGNFVLANNTIATNPAIQQPGYDLSHHHHTWSLLGKGQGLKARWFVLCMAF